MRPTFYAPLGAVLIFSTACDRAEAPVHIEEARVIVQRELAGARIDPRALPTELAAQSVDVRRPEVNIPLMTGRIPDLGGAPLFSSPGGFTFPSGTAPGSGSFTGAPMVDWNSSSQPAFLGTGSINITVNGVAYNHATAESASGILEDDLGNDYLMLSAWAIELDPVTMVELGSVLHVIVPVGDFAPGATVAFDGVDRLAYFAWGDINQPEPQIVAVAVTGSVVFTSGGLNLGDLITASTSGDFGEIQWQSTPPPPTTPGNIPAGSYTLTVNASPYVYCDGTLMGQEAAFAAITAAGLGFNSGAVTVTTVSTTMVDISGAPISSAFGAPSLTLENHPDNPPGLFAGFSNANVPGGPVNTTLIGAYLALDGSGQGPLYPGAMGAGYLTADQQGFCSVDFEVNMQ